MATGKTNPRFYRLILDQVDLSGDSRQIGSFGVEYETPELTGWSDGVKNHNLGLPTHIFSGYQAVFNNTASTGSFTELSAIEEYIASLLIGIRAAPAVGDPAFLTSIEQIGNVLEGQEAILINVDGAKSITNVAYPRPWGVGLAVGASLAATTNGASVDNGASSANGCLAHLHVTVSDGGTWALKVQDSPDDAIWSDLITFSADGSAVTAETGTAAGTVDRYLRFQATRTSGTLTAWVTVARQ